MVYVIVLIMDYYLYFLIFVLVWKFLCVKGFILLIVIFLLFVFWLFIMYFFVIVMFGYLFFINLFLLWYGGNFNIWCFWYVFGLVKVRLYYLFLDFNIVDRYVVIFYYLFIIIYLVILIDLGLLYIMYICDCILVIMLCWIGG